MAYKVLIVEDEKEKARGIAYLIEKYNPECEPILLAYDGSEGYEKALAECPDIILTDIRMPVMDGLEMIRALKKKEFMTEFVVLSSYAEFEYAKQSIELGVRDFITKPVDEKELSETLTKLSEEIEAKRATENSLEKLREDVINYAMRDFLTGDAESQNKIGEYLKHTGILKKYSRFTCIAIEREGDSSETKPILDLPDDIFLCGVRMSNTQMSYIIGSNEMDVQKRRQLLQDYMDKNGQTFLSMGVGNSYEDYTQLSKSYEEASIALNYRILKGNGMIIFFDELYDMENRTDYLELLTEKEAEQLKERVDRFDQEGFQIVVKSIFNRVLAEKNLTLPELQILSLNIVLLGLHNIPMAQLRMNEYFGRNLFTLRSIEKFQTIEQLENWIKNMVNSVNEVMLKDNVPKKTDIITEVKEYIRQNYNQNISLNDISKKYYINPYYFSQLFKKKMGMTYQKYLTDYRIDRAKKLLTETDLRIYEVCRLVGYNDVNHFNKIFERTEGMKPSEYRQQYTQND